jgi:hypothetical protein
LVDLLVGFWYFPLDGFLVFQGWDDNTSALKKQEEGQEEHASFAEISFDYKEIAVNIGIGGAKVPKRPGRSKRDETDGYLYSAGERQRQSAKTFGRRRVVPVRHANG